MIKLSPSEQVYLQRGVAQNMRIDGRECTQMRAVTVETGIVSQANGSARVRLGDTDVVVGIKIEVGSPNADTPDLGLIECSVECAPSASPEFEGRGASEINSELAAGLSRICLGGVDLAALCLAPGVMCWVVYVDAIVLASAGNLLGAVALATRAALASATIPKVTVVAGESPGTFELEVSDDPFEVTTISVAEVPIAVTLTSIAGCYVADATLEEEYCRTVSITFGVSAAGRICGVHKSGPGGVSPALLMEMTTVAGNIGRALIEDLDNVVRAQAGAPAKVGFLA